MKRVLIIINSLGVGGAERLVLDDIKFLTASGHNVKLLTLFSENKKSTLIDEVITGNISMTCIEFKNFYNIFNFFKIVKFISSYKPDVVFTHLWHANTVGRLACVCARVKNIFSFEHNVYDSVKPKSHYLIDKYLQFSSKKIFAVSVAVKDSLIRNGISDKKIDVLFNSIDVDKFINASPIPRKTLGLTDDDFVFIFVGRLVHQKAVDILIDAFSQNNVDKLLVVGDGHLRNEFEQKIKKDGLGDSIKFLGVRADIPNLLKSSNCFVLPSRYEGVGIVALEALASGLPVIVSDFQASREFIQHEVNGLVVPLEDSISLSNAMNRIRTDSSLRAKLIENSSFSALQFSHSHRMNYLLNLIDN